VAACPSEAACQLGFTTEQIFAEITGILQASQTMEISS
jgi:hypothetical protein